ncbi:MAG TPA: Dyp-type peroxidase [Symbiobacteriaceae bacterium]|nr:Dyp-type peroxidase [Symbiobacteriaceae bacterium]
MSELFAQEPQLDAADIQGNILSGFHKNRQWLLGLSIDGVTAPGNRTDPAVRAAREWIAALAPRIATMDRVAEHNRWFRQEHRRTGKEPVSEHVWTHVAFTYSGLVKLAGPAAEGFTHPPFRLGMAARSSFLGDPLDPAAPGHPRNWLVGGPASAIDILLIVAGDSPKAVSRAVTETLRGAPARVVYKEQGKVRTDSVAGLCMHGHEHFGFKDGISQPAVRGWFRLPNGEAVPVTHREAPLVQPGQFVFGYPLQHDRKPAEGVTLTLEAQGVPAWAKNGSFLAFRRLRQDVALYRRTVAERARELQVDPEWLGSRIVGRWQSGAPVMRAPAGEDRELGADRLARNNFQYANPGTPDGRPGSPPDPLGLTCPIAAHIRKVNPRDEATDTGSLAGTLTRRIIRRGIPYGEPLPPDGPDRGERGLLFLSYQTSLEDQFEFLQNNWMNRVAAPNPGGHDPLLGQNALAEHRERAFLLGPGAEVKGLPDFVIPTGGAYLFSPSLTALREVLGG